MTQPSRPAARWLEQQRARRQLSRSFTLRQRKVWRRRCKVFASQRVSAPGFCHVSARACASAHARRLRATKRSPRPGLPTFETVSTRVMCKYTYNPPMKKTIQVQASMGESFGTTIEARGHVLHVDQPRDAGGDDTGPTPLELVLASLAGCYTAIGRIIARQRQLPLMGMAVSVAGTIDTDGLLGKPSDERVGFSEIVVEVRPNADLSPEDQRALVEEIERRCPVSDNIANSTRVVLDMQVSGAS